MQAPIVEIFETIQGEGKSIGTPSIFVRFYGCNLRCQFKGIECDTPYAVYREQDKSIMMTPLEVANKIKSLNPKHIVWTGGEPMLYQDFIYEVMTDIYPEYTAEVETNTTIPLKLTTIQVIDQFNMSVKLGSSQQTTVSHELLRYNPDAIKTYPSSKSYFKFVISYAEKDLMEIQHIIHRDFPQFEIYLMPEGYRRDQLIENSIEVVELCVKYGYKFSPREHIIIWDYKRGV